MTEQPNRTVVRCTHEDSVHVTGADGLAVQWPAAVLLTVDRVLRECRDRDDSLVVERIGGTWLAYFETFPDDEGEADTPLAAVIDLAATFAARRERKDA